MRSHFTWCKLRQVVKLKLMLYATGAESTHRAGRGIGGTLRWSVQGKLRDGSSHSVTEAPWELLRAVTRDSPKKQWPEL